MKKSKYTYKMPTIQQVGLSHWIASDKRAPEGLRSFKENWRSVELSLSPFQPMHCPHLNSFFPEHWGNFQILVHLPNMRQHAADSQAFLNAFGSYRFNPFFITASFHVCCCCILWEYIIGIIAIFWLFLFFSWASHQLTFRKHLYCSLLLSLPPSVSLFWPASFRLIITT